MQEIIDFHSHILPGVDDGSKSLGDSLEMLKQTADQGIRRMVATPHFYANHDTPRAFLERRDTAYRQLLEGMAQEPGLPGVTLGAEVYFFRGISDCESISELTIGNTGYLLVEMPPPPWRDAMYRELESLSICRGITPIIAHVDRYLGLFRTFHIPEQLEARPVLVQANAEFFLKPARRHMALKMLRTGQIHLLGSDCHNVTSRVPNLGDAVDVIRHRLGADALEWVAQHQTAILR